jgi:hypothetical protein
MSNTATLVRRLGGSYSGDARLYRLDPPFAGHRYVIASAVTEFVVETLVFPADESGEVTDWGDIAGVRGETDHAAALADLGYEVSA